jgi:hypothetical protein
MVRRRVLFAAGGAAVLAMVASLAMRDGHGGRRPSPPAAGASGGAAPADRVGANQARTGRPAVEEGRVGSPADAPPPAATDGSGEAVEQLLASGGPARSADEVRYPPMHPKVEQRGDAYPAGPEAPPPEAVRGPEIERLVALRAQVASLERLASDAQEGDRAGYHLEESQRLLVELEASLGTVSESELAHAQAAVSARAQAPATPPPPR